MIKFLVETTQNTDFNPPTSFWIGMGILIVILLVPWIVLLVYTLTLKYRIRVFSGDHLVATYMLKADQKICIKYPRRDGYEVEGLYRDDTFMLPFEYKKMPKQNLKVYIKWEKTES